MSDSTIPEVDAYIEKAPEFAQEIMKKLRKIAHKSSPRITEAMKWSSPHFVGNSIVSGMIAYKKHVSFYFWHGTKMKDPEKIFPESENKKMRILKLTDVKEVPTQKALLAYYKEALALDGEEARAERTTARKKSSPIKIVVPKDLAAEFKKTKHKKAAANFKAFSPSKQRDYVEWIEGAKREATREKRLATALEWLSEGKSRNWKYER